MDGKTVISSQEEIKNRFNDEAANYRAIAKLVNFDIAGDTNLFETFIKTLDKLFPDHNENINILDIGAGNGMLTELIMEAYPNAHFTLLDFSNEMLASAKTYFNQKANANSSKINYVLSNFITDSLPNGPFDLVVSSYAMHHCRSSEELSSTFSKIKQVLKEGTGTFLCIDMFLANSVDARKRQANRAVEKWTENFKSREEAQKWAAIIKEEDTPSTLATMIPALYSGGLPLLLDGEGVLATIYGMTKRNHAEIQEIGLAEWLWSWRGLPGSRSKLQDGIYETGPLPFDLEGVKSK